MEICLPAGKKRLYKKTREEPKNRTNILKEFLFPVAMRSSLFFTHHLHFQQYITHLLVIWTFDCSR